MAIVVSSEPLEDSYLPDKLLFRDKELKTLSSLANGGLNIAVQGPAGSGKTTLVRYALANDLLRSYDKAIYVDCILFQTTNSVLKEILYEVSPLSSIPQSNSSLISRLALKARNRKLLVVLDHFDRVYEQDVVDKLLSLGVKLIIIMNRDVKLSEAARARIAYWLRLERYTLNQVREILLERVKVALRPGSCSDEVLNEIARRSNGNASLALTMLKAAVSVAESLGEDYVSINHIPAFMVENEKLGDDEALLLQILREHRRLHASKLYEAYKRLSLSPKGERSFRRYMGRLVAKGLVRAIGAKRWRIYEVVG